MTENVTNLQNVRRTKEEARHADAERAYEKTRQAAMVDHKNNLLTLLQNCISLVEKGEIEGLALCGRNPNNGVFLSTIVMNRMETRVDTLLAYSGALETLKQDFTDLANSGPHMNSDGSYFALEMPEGIDFHD